MPSNQGLAEIVLTNCAGLTANAPGFDWMRESVGSAGAKYIRNGSPARLLDVVIQRLRFAVGVMILATLDCFTRFITLLVVVPPLVARRVIVPVFEVRSLGVKRLAASPVPHAPSAPPVLVPVENVQFAVSSTPPTYTRISVGEL